MSEDKYDKLLNAAIVLLIVSATVLGYSVYNNNFSNKTIKTDTANAVAFTNLRDSLKDVYTNTVTSIDTNLVKSNGEANPELLAKYKEVDELKAEIRKLLTSQGEGDVLSAQQKILELKQKINNLEIQYDDAASENKKLQAIIEQLKQKNNQTNLTVNGTGANSNATTNSALEKRANDLLLAQEAKNGNPQIKNISTQKVNQTTEMQFFATTNGGEKQTTKIADAEKLYGSFLFKYVAPYSPNDFVYIVIIQPNGKTVKGPSWDIGVFNSDEGKKVYSKKIPVELDGNPLRLEFSVPPDDFIAGPYKMEIWYKTNLIGTKVRTLL